LGEEAIPKAFSLNNDNYEIWHVVTFVSENQRDQVLNECKRFVNRIIEFPEIMHSLVDYFRNSSNTNQETEVLRTEP
jgi:hypothetical protein